MDSRVLELIAAYEEELNIPEEKRTTRFSNQLKTFILKDEKFFDKAKSIRDDVLTLMGCTLTDFAEDQRYADSGFVKTSVQKVVRPIRIASEEFEVIELFDKPVLFTHERLMQEDVPSGMYKYDICHDSNFQGDMVQLKINVLVNHWGSIISKEPFENIQEIDGCKVTVNEGLALTQNDYNYTGDTYTIDEYLNSYDELLQNCNFPTEDTGGMSGVNM